MIKVYCMNYMRVRTIWSWVERGMGKNKIKIHCKKIFK